MTDPDFLARFHAGFGVPRDDVVAFVQRGTRSGVADIERLALGDENEVYRLRLATTDALAYVRIRRPRTGTFDAEVWAMEQARAEGVAVPTVLALDEFATAEGARPAMLIAASPGRPLVDVLPTLTAEQRHIAMTNLGRTLGMINTLRTPGVARPDPEGRWPGPRELLEAFVTERRGQQAQLGSAGLTESEVDSIMETIGTSPDIPAPADPVLCHGDLHPGHAFINERLEVSGVIDWGLWHGGSAIDDLSTMFMRYTAADFASILGGHGHDNDEDFRRRLALATINQTVGHVAWSVSIGNIAGSAHGAATLRAALRQLNIET